MLWKLEDAWGLENNSLNLDSRHDLIYLAPTIRQLFDDGEWALVPPLEWLRKIGLLVLRKKLPRFDDETISSGHDYTFLPLRDDIHPFVRHRPDGTNEIYSYPFQELPPVRSHTHAFFVVCNLAQKEQQLRELDAKKNAEPIPPRTDYAEALDLCIEIYNSWLAFKKSPLLPSSRPQLPPRDPSPSSERSTKTSSQNHEQDVRAARRAEKRQASQLDASTSQRDSGDMNSTYSQHKVPKRPRAASLPTPQYAHTNLDKRQLFDNATQLIEVPLDIIGWAEEVALYSSGSYVMND